MNHEFDAIFRLFQQRVPFQHHLTQVKNGDDASTHHIPSGFELVVSTDTAVSGVHWPDNMPLDIAASRAVNAALSDLAAMGAEPAWIWLAIMAKDKHDLQHMSNGIVQSCLEHHVELAGGDTVCSPINTMVVTVGGLIPTNHAMRRDQANIGDEIWLIGQLGLSASGLEQWLCGDIKGQHVPYFQHISPLLKEALKLRTLGVRCCIDISDGLLQDAGHIAKASQVSMQITLENIQQLASLKKLQHLEKEKALKFMLSGGEDYALLFTAPPEKHEHIRQLGAQLLGHCKQGDETILMHQGKAVDFNIKGYDHFG